MLARRSSLKRTERPNERRQNNQRLDEAGESIEHRAPPILARHVTKPPLEKSFGLIRNARTWATASVITAVSARATWADENIETNIPARILALATRIDLT